jgi:outer membrane murein-binding lipoprotein Lpp
MNISGKKVIIVLLLVLGLACLVSAIVVSLLFLTGSQSNATNTKRTKSPNTKSLKANTKSLAQTQNQLRSGSNTPSTTSTSASTRPTEYTIFGRPILNATATYGGSGDVNSNRVSRHASSIHHVSSQGGTSSRGHVSSHNYSSSGVYESSDDD